MDRQDEDRRFEALLLHRGVYGAVGSTVVLMPKDERTKPAKRSQLNKGYP